MYLDSQHHVRQGIGKCTAELFAREGALVTVTDLDAGKHVLYI